MHRFLVSADVFRGARVHLSGEVAHQISRVLRLRLGDDVVLLDGQGYEYKVKLASYGKDELWADVLGKEAAGTEASRNVTIYLALLNKADKFEWALQKCTELGAARFVPVVAERSVTSSGRQQRWVRITTEAVEQSGRVLIPEVEEPRTLKEAIAEEAARIARPQGTAHIAYVLALGAKESLRSALPDAGSAGSVSLFIGPEGGFTESEVEAAAGAGIRPVSLGPRVLRAETAAVAALTVVLSSLGEMD
ncbi:MAG TPA: 16S rRNA (uracil(1498)-N(3))-methyltransferase [Chloroflexia bacterium]|nr:16S rRNA (uracil(1498)-N(3))-methyltransferase [Chloroflexia bacterium]